MADKRIYTIQINGLQESYDGVVSLRDALSGLTDTVVNVSKQETKAASTRKEAAAGTDALAKATQKLNEWDRAYQAELALVNKELSDNKKEIKDAIKLQEAQAVVDAKQLDTYRDKQTYLSALNTLIRNHSTATEEDNQAIAAMMQESAALQQELKDVDSQMKIYVRNVGNYPGAAQMVVESHKSLKQELKELKAEMAEMLASGVSKTDEAYLKLAERAGQLKDAMSDANQDITNFASDTRGLTNAINLASSAVNAYQLYNSALQVFGGENEEAAKSMQKMMAVMTLLKSLQQVQNSLLENGSATARLYSKAVELIQSALGLKKAATEEDIAVTEAATVAEETNTAVQEANTVAQELNATANEANAASTGAATTAEVSNTGAVTANTTATQANTVATNSMSVAQKAGAVASKTLSVALRAIPLMAIIGLVMALIQNWESIWNWFKKTFPVLDTLSKKFNKFGGFMNAVVTGAKAVGAAIVNWLINPFKTFADVIGKVLKGDFSGAWQAAVDGVKNQFKGTADAFKAEVVKGYAQGQEEMTRKSAAENEKRLEHHKNMITKQKNADGTYRKEYIKAEQAVFDNKKKMYKKGSDEYNKVLEDEARFHQQVEDAKTSATEKGTKARTAAAKKAAADAKKAADEAKKAAEQAEKERQKLYQDTEKSIENAEKLADATTKKMLKVSDDIIKAEQKNNAKYAQLTDEQIANAQKYGMTVHKKLKEVQAILKEVSETATESEISLLKGFINEIGNELSQVNKFIEDSKNSWLGYVEDVGKAMNKRKEIAVNQIALEAIETKKNYEKNIKELREYLAQLEELKKKQTGKALDDTEKLIQRTTQAVKDGEAAMKAELDKYAKDFNIYIPIDLDLENLEARFNRLQDDLIAKGNKLTFSFNDVINVLLGLNGTLERLYATAESQGSDKLFETFRDLGTVIGMSKGETEDHLNELQNFLDLVMDPRPFKEKSAELSEFLTKCSIDIEKFGSYSKEAADKLKQITDETVKMFEDEYKAFVTQQDKIISYNDKVIKKFQDATKDIKFEPVMVDDGLSRVIEGQIMSMDKTKERYDKLKQAYLEYQNTLKAGSKEREAYEDAWNQKLNATATHVDLIGQMYGKSSTEYKNAVMEYELLVDEKKKADAAYAIEYEKVTKQIEEIDKKSNQIREDYFESLHKRMNEIYSAFNENMFQPLAEGFGALLDFQLEEAQEALDEVTKLYDKAVEAREKSAERLKEINDELRNDEGANKEALQERLAEEEVLLVQREEAERALAKEKEKREKEVQKKEKQQRKLELGQKLLEGIANTALGVTAALKYGFPLGPVFAAIIGAMGALQTALIAKQISKLEKGGKVGENGVSRSHKQGGHRIEDTNIEVEGGEWVINKKSSQKYDTMLRAINDDNIGLVRKQVEIIRERRIVNNNVISKFASGGQINTLTATRAVRDNNDIQAITDLIRQIDFQPTVAVTDINKVNKNLVRVQQYAGKTV